MLKVHVKIFQTSCAKRGDLCKFRNCRQCYFVFFRNLAFFSSLFLPLACSTRARRRCRCGSHFQCQNTFTNAIIDRHRGECKYVPSILAIRVCLYAYTSYIIGVNDFRPRKSPTIIDIIRHRLRKRNHRWTCPRRGAPFDLGKDTRSIISGSHPRRKVARSKARRKRHEEIHLIFT